MIRLHDASILALTKLRTRRIRTTITIVISGLLFSTLIAALLVSQGVVRSLHAFSNIGFGNRYIVQATSQPDIGDIIENPTVMQRAEAIYNQTVTAREAAAKKFGVTYDPASEPQPTQQAPGSASTQAFLNISAPSATQAINEYVSTHKPPGLSDLQRIAASNHPRAFYKSSMLMPINGPLTTMNKGVEDFNQNSNSALSGPDANDPLVRFPLTLMSDPLTQPFMLPNAQATTAEANDIPVIAPYSVATQLLGLSSLPNNATAAQKLDRVATLYARSGSITFSACYRNTVSAQQIQDAISSAADIAAHAHDKTYQKPSLIYGLPASDSCGQAPILGDTRTADEKKQAHNEDLFNAAFGAITTPDQQKITFHVVGLVPDSPSGPSNSASGIFQGLVGSSLQGTLAIPETAYQNLPGAARYNQLLTADTSNVFSTPASYYAEFSSADEARNFIDTKSCVPTQDNQCKGAAKPFMLSAFGSNSIAIRDLQRKFSRGFQWTGLAVVVIAIVIMTGTIGRMIADGRRETAIFRAIGAERIDITIIYILYTLGLSLLVTAFALGFGILAAYSTDRYVWQSATAYAQLSFGGDDLSLRFHLFAYDARIWFVVLGALAAGFMSMLLPLVRNVRRNPINDMRDE